jgi:carboxypeptidase C (cathepsin A)
MAVTQHHAMIGGRALNYTARAGRLPIRDSVTGEVHAYIFFTAYTVDSPHLRPLTFVWNGGPGSNSTYLHLAGIGPRHIKGEDDPVNPPTVESEVEDNEGTWLEQTDLVFVDPVGTGFSRATKPEYENEFYSVLGDIASVAEFIRVYRERFNTWDAPLFLAGESYGTWRASGVAEALERGGVKVAGVVLISGGIQVGSVGSDEMKTALYLPRLTAAAFFHKKLEPDLQNDLQRALDAAETWAKNEYDPALEKRDTLSEEQRQAVIMQLARFTGLNAAAIDRDQFNLTLSSGEFCADLLRDEKLTCQLLDDRLTNQKPPRGHNEVISRYFRSELHYNPDLTYAGVEQGFSGSPERSIGERWSWNQAKSAPPNTDTHAIYGLNFDTGPLLHRDAIVVGSGNGPPSLAEPWLLRAMKIDPALRVFVATGIYDSLNSCAYIPYLISHLEPAQVNHNISTGCYSSGHVIYETKDARLQLKGDVTKFIRDASNTGSSASSQYQK